MKNSKTIVIITILVLVFLSLFFVACPTTTEKPKTTTTTIFSATATADSSADLYFRGSFTKWEATDDAALRFNKFSDGSYRATVDFGALGITGRARFKFVHQQVGDDWADAQTINGFDPANPSGDPETDLLSTWTDTPKEGGYVIAKIKGGMNNMTIFQEGGKYTFRLAYLVVPAAFTDNLSSTHADEYVLIDTIIDRAGTAILPTDRIHPDQNVGIGGDFTATAWDPADAGSLLTKNDTAKTFSKTFTLTAGDKSFAICNPDWDYKWCGIKIWEVTSDTTKKVGAAVPLVAGAADNATFVVTNAGDYEFVVNYTDVKAPTLTINKK